ncbi:MAG: glycosyltransferase 87 family protein [Solirubrobacteraceae bacterium]
MRVLAIATLAASGALALPAAPATAASVASHSASAHSSTPSTRSSTLTTSTSSPSGDDAETPVPVTLSNVPPAAHRLSSEKALAIANRLPEMRALQAEHRGSFGDVYLKGAFQWQVSYFTRGGKKEIGLVIINDVSGRVVEQWTGFQVAWTMARGYPGAFGRHVNALYIWLPLCVLFVLPFVNFRRPFSLLHLDLLVLLSFSVSLAFFNHARIYASVPLAYPPLLYLLARMLALLRRVRSSRRPPPLRLLVPTPWLALGVVFLLGFRVALNVTDSNVIDVGYAGVIGAQRIVDGKPLYSGYPSDNEHGDTYGPVSYEAYVPFEQAFGWTGKWDDLPAAHAAAIFFDLLATALLFLIGRRMRGPTLGVALAYAWVSYPFTLYALESNSNDSLVGALVLAAVLAASYRAELARAGCGALAALAGLTKFAPLALAPLLATDGLSGLSLARRVRALALYAAGFAVALALACIPALSHDSLHTIYERTIVYQSNRGSPFSIWGLYGLQGAERVVQGAAVALALALAVVPRRPDPVGLAAACAAVILAEQLGIEHWFYLYIPWFFPLAIVALLGCLSGEGGTLMDPPPAAASAPARSSLRAAAVSS